MAAGVMRPTPGALPPPERGSVIAGKAWVTDGDGLRVSGYTVRFAALDAPEWDQWAKHRDGYLVQARESASRAR